MSNQQINQYLDEQTTPNDGDWYDIDAYNGGTPLSKKISWATIKNSIIQSSPNIYKADGILTGDRDVNLDSNFLRFRNGVTMFGGSGNSALSAVSLSKKNTGVNEYLRAWDDSNSSFWQIGSDQRFTYRTASGGFIALGDETNGGTQLNSKWLSLHGDVALRSGKTFNFGDSNQITNDSNFLGFGLDAISFKSDVNNINFFNIIDIGSSSSIVSVRPDATSSVTQQSSGFVFDASYWNGTTSVRKQSILGYSYESARASFATSFDFSNDYGLSSQGATSLAVFPISALNTEETTLTLSYDNGSSVATQTVTVGAINSGGTGYRVLRVPN